MSEFRDIHGDCMEISKSSNLIWITCSEDDASVTELAFNQEVIKEVISELRKQLKEKG